MADPVEAELLEYEDMEEVNEPTVKTNKGSSVRDIHVGVHSTGFRDFLLCPELLSAIGDCAFEHPSQVQQKCIPQALLGSDIICQGKSGMGKTAVFAISVLQQIDPVEGEVSCLCIAPTRELVFQIGTEFNRFSKYMPKVKSIVIYGGIPKQSQIDLIKTDKPNIVIATPGRCLDLLREKKVLDVSKVRFFIIDEADKVLENEDMRKDVEKIYKKLPAEKQSMLFSATISDQMKDVCKKFTHDAVEVYVDDESQLTLNSVQQYFVKLTADQKNRKLIDILDSYSFNQVVIFVDKVSRAKALDELLNECQYPSICIHSKMSQPDRIKAYRQFKDFQKKILVSTDVFARGIDIQRVNIVINYDMPRDSDTYHHRVGRAGRFGTKGLAISFVSTEEDTTKLKEIQDRFEVEIKELPSTLDAATYMNA